MSAKTTLLKIAGLFKGTEKNARGINLLMTFIFLAAGLVMWFIPREQLKNSTTPNDRTSFVIFTTLAISLMAAATIHFGFVILHTYKIERVAGMTATGAEAIATVVENEEKQKSMIGKFMDRVFNFFANLFKEKTIPTVDAKFLYE